MTDQPSLPLRRPRAFDRVVAIVPVRSLETAKSRLGEPLDAEERAALVGDLLADTVHAARRAGRVHDVLVVSADPALLAVAETLGAGTVRDAGRDLNEAIEEAREVVLDRGATAILVLPADLPRVSAGALDDVVGAAAQAARGTSIEGPIVAIVPDRHGEGTNALLVTPPDAIRPAFGPGSRERHAAAARAAGAIVVELGGPLALDLDTAEDLLLAGDVLGERVAT